MEDGERKRVIEFYETQVWVPGLRETLTEEELNHLSDTLMFARWMLASQYDECVNAIRTAIKVVENNLLSAVFSVGKKVYFSDEKLPYNVMAVSKRYALVSRKLNRREDAELIHHMVKMSAYLSFTQAYNDNKDTPVYSVIDFTENKRSSNNLVFGIFDYFDEVDCKKAIGYLETGGMELSSRDKAELVVDFKRSLK